MTVVMQLELKLKYFKTAFEDFKVFTGLRLHHLTTFTGGWVACLKLETGDKAILASIDILKQLLRTLKYSQGVGCII